MNAPVKDHVIDDLLTDEERANLALDTSDTDGKPAEVVDAPAETPTPAEPAKPVAAAAAAGAAAPAEPPAAPAEPAAAPAPSQPREFMPQFVAQGVTAEMEAELAGLEAKLDAGELTLADYNKTRDEINFRKFEQDFAQRQNQAQAEQRWQWEVERFMDDHTTYRDNKLLNAAFDRAVKDLAADEKNGDKSMRWFLVEADRAVSALLGAKPTAAPTAAPTPGGAVAPRTPLTLAAVPAAGRGEAAETEFSHLDGLMGEELEAEVAKMTPAAKARYLAA